MVQFSGGRPWGKPLAALVSSAQKIAPNRQVRFVLYDSGVIIYGQQRSPGGPARYARAFLQTDEIKEIVPRLHLAELAGLDRSYGATEVLDAGTNVVVFRVSNGYREIRVDGAIESDIPGDLEVRAARAGIPEALLAAFDFMRDYRSVAAEPWDPLTTIVGLWRVKPRFTNRSNCMAGAMGSALEARDQRLILGWGRIESRLAGVEFSRSTGLG